MHISKLNLTLLSLSLISFSALIQCGPIQFVLDELEKDNMPHVELPDGFEELAKESFKALISPH